MKNVLPFLGISAPIRRREILAVMRQIPTPTCNQLIDTVDTLWDQPFREFQQAGCDVLAYATSKRWGIPDSQDDAEVLIDAAQRWLTAKAWWDTVDGLGTALITPIVARYPRLVDTMEQWVRLPFEDRAGTLTPDTVPPNVWLIRAAIGHQRGLGPRTDVERVVEMCALHAHTRMFWIAKAVGWALRDLSAIDAGSVVQFLRVYPDLPGVAKREAQRGIGRITFDT